MADQAQQFNQITQRKVMGMFFLALEQYLGQTWIDKVSNAFESNQELETYAGLGMVPQFREWVGSKQANSFNEFSITIVNRDFEATIAFKNKDLRRDKTDQVRARIGDLAQRAIAHDALLLSGLINGGTSTTVTISGMRSTVIKCYDGQALFSSSHTIGTQSLNNSITLSLTTLATSLGTSVGVGTTTTPTPAAVAALIQLCVQQLYGFVDDQGQPLNEFSREFIVMVPVSFSGAANAAVKGQYLALGYDNPLKFVEAPSLSEVGFTVVPNPRLTWTTSIAVFCADCPYKALIRQYEQLTADSSDEMGFGEDEGLPVGSGIVMKVLGPGSDHEYKNNEQLFSVEKSGFAGWGRFDTCVYGAFVS